MKPTNFICSPGIWSFGNYSTEDFTGMTPECEATLSALDARIQAFEEELAAGKAG
ncbi:hypothetical protein CPT_Pascal40 [Bacillus phage Pascal]|uniref:Uncharacterized protein n=1 Tax=Bacillus phage Pascal TaxID=1540092 RepID=A0A0A0RNI8_9CAUD|nr:hypothetical protein CPT_Pascal40 [Bacillus phage Pascal]AIW03675.1 hypothetical protein CPT_Pascal40 [Bacillus phage Pascal]